MYRWTEKTKFAENNTVIDSLECGMDPIATDGMDDAFGETELPRKLYGSGFDVRFVGENLGNGIKRDIRESTYEQTEYMIELQRSSVSDVTISWNKPPGFTIYLQDMSKEPIFSVVMTSISEITITDENITVIKLIVSNKQGTPTIKPPSHLQVSDVPEDYGHSLKLTWTESLSEEDNLVSWYRIYRSRSDVLTDLIPLTRFTSLDSLNSWDEHYTILIDSVAAGTTEYIDRYVPLNSVPYYYWVEAVGEIGVGKKTASGNKMIIEENPAEFSISAPYPNPFNPSTTFMYSIPEECFVKLVIYDILGRRIVVVHDGVLSPGVHEAVWEGKDNDGLAVGTGVYLYRFMAGSFRRSGKLMLLR